MQATELLEGNEDEFLRNLLGDVHQQELGLGGTGSDKLQKPPYKSVAPKPGFCLKTHDDKDGKVFINVCHSDLIPEPRNVTDDELVELLEADEPGNFRIPMSLGEPHAEVDNRGSGCTAYDVIVAPQMFQQLDSRRVLMGFFLTVLLEGLESKYSIQLSREWKILKNRKFVGSLPEQHVRRSSQPLIREVGGSSLISEVDSEEAKKAEEQMKKRIPEPAYTIIQEPPTGHPEFLIAEIHLPKVKSAASLTLDLGEDRILLETRASIYRLDIYVPYDILPEESGAQFNRSSKIMTVTMPVASTTLR